MAVEMPLQQMIETLTLRALAGHVVPGPACRPAVPGRGAESCKERAVVPESRTEAESSVARPFIIRKQ
jgi:hypothetical protein